MITSNNIDSISYTLFLSDLINPLESDLRITFVKPESNFTKTVTPSIDNLLNNISILEWCMVALVDEDLANGKIYLPTFGEYKMTIETKDTLSLTWTIIWIDLYRMVGNEITTYGL